MSDRDVVIVGGGPAGISAAIWCQRLGLSYEWYEKESTLGGQLSLIHNEIVDVPGLWATDGSELSTALISHVARIQSKVHTGWRLEAVDIQRRTIRLAPTPYSEGSQREVGFQALIIATGAREGRLNIPGEAEMFQRNEWYSTARDAARFMGHSVAMVGGGDRAVEGAYRLAEAGAHVHLIHRSERFQARPSMLEPVFLQPNVTLHTNSEVTEIQGTQSVTSIIVRAKSSGIERVLPVRAVFIRVGVRPNTAPCEGQLNLDQHGYILVDAKQESNVNGIFAAGDVCTQAKYAHIAGAMGQGATAAKAAYEYLQETGNCV